MRPIGAEQRQDERKGFVVRIKTQRCKVVLGSVGVRLLRNVLRSFHNFKFQQIFQRFGTFVPVLESKFGLKTESLTCCHIDMTRYCIRNPSDRSAVYTVAYIGEEELCVNFFPIFLLQSIQLICLAVLNGVSGIIDPQQIQNNIRAELTDTDNFEAYALGIAFVIQKTELADLFCFRC